MKAEQTLRERWHLLTEAFRHKKILYLPLVVTLPFAFLWFALFLRMAACALLLPGAVFLHEFLHLLFIPSWVHVRVVSQGSIVAIDFDATLSPGRNLLIALAPHVVMWGAATCLWRKDPLLALPFVLSGLSLPADVHSWYRRSFFHG